jgi:hypothetical protein
METSERTHCANCAAQLSGAYCQDCGQPAHIHRSLWHMVEELLHGIFHFDNKAWRTLPALLWKPGQLTRDYIDGKRTRYMAPFILFLFLNFVMFFVFSYLGSNLTHDKSYKSYIKEGLTNELSNSKTKLAELEAKRSSLGANDQGIKALMDEISNLRKKQIGYEKTMAAINAEDTITNTPPEKDSAEKNRTDKNTIPTTDDKKFWLDQAINHAFQNPDLTLYKMKGTASKFAFILIPISLPFMWLLFIRRKDIHLFDHAVFALYSLSFMCLLLMLVAGLARLGLAGCAWLLFLAVPPIHIFVQLRGAYQLTVASALWRTIAIASSAGFALSVYFIMITWLSL